MNVGYRYDCERHTIAIPTLVCHGAVEEGADVGVTAGRIPVSGVRHKKGSGMCAHRADGCTDPVPAAQGEGQSHG